MVADGIDNIDEKLDYYIGENKHLEAELAKCKAERDEVRELVTMRLEDMNRNGKTILDFYAVWLRQSRDEITKLRARCERYEAALEKIGGSGPVPTPDEAWSWCYDVAKQALEVPRG